MTDYRDYRCLSAYPDIEKTKPKNRYCIRGNSAPLVVGFRNTGVSRQRVFCKVSAVNDTNNMTGVLDINITAAPVASPLDGTPVPDDQISVFFPGISAEFNTGVSIPVGVPPLSAYDRLYLEANGGESTLLIGEDKTDPGLAVFLEFAGLVNIDEYTVVFELVALETVE